MDEICRTWQDNMRQAEQAVSGHSNQLSEFQQWSQRVEQSMAELQIQVQNSLQNNELKRQIMQ